MTALLALLLAAPAHAWTADEPWRTVETEHFRIHYPVDTEAWALDVAGRADEMRERVASVVGYLPDDKTELVVLDPWSQANGFALPFASGPRIGLFVTAPVAASGIGHYRLWGEDLLVHEDAHVLHLTRPARNPVEHVVFDKLLGVPVIAVKSPAWVVEGYATLVEGQLTGKGRPNSDGRAVFLRTLARQGQLPTYGELDGSSRWMGRSMRYLVGSAFLEWLAWHHGDDALPQLWARMTAEEIRSFDAAFVGVFGAPPAELYGRFCAELSAGALSTERSGDLSRLFMDLSGTVGAPAVSPGGERVAVVTQSSKGPRALVVYGTGVDEDAQQARAEDIAEQLEDDPDDVAPVDPRHPPRPEVGRRVHAGWSAHMPAFIDEDTLLFSAFVQDSHGVVQPDLFTWNVDTGRERRLTRNADLREASPCVGSDWAVAVHRDQGHSSLVRVDLTTGTTTPLTAPSAVVVDAWPRLDAACEMVVWQRHEAGSWWLALAPVHTLSPDTPVPTLPLPDGAQLVSATLTPDGQEVVASLGRDGFVDLWSRPITGLAAPWTQRSVRDGGAFSPAVGADGTVWFLSADASGHDLYALDDAGLSIPENIATDGIFTRAVVRPPPVTDAPPLPESRPLTPAPYGLGPQHIRVTAGARSVKGTPGSADLHEQEAGLYLGDVVGRSELVALVGLSGSELSGGRVAWTWRRFPVHLTVDGYSLLAAEPAVVGGGAVSLAHHRRHSGGGFSVLAGGFGEAGGAGGAAALSGAHRVVWGPWSVLGQAVTDGRLTSDGAAGRGGVALRAGRAWWRVGAEVEEGRGSVARMRPWLEPTVRTSGTVFWPEAGDLAATSARRVRGTVGLPSDRVVVFGEWLQPLDCVGPCSAAQTLAGVEVLVGTPTVPIASVPGLTLSGGLALDLTDDAGALALSQATDWAVGWRGWFGLRVVPGRPPAYPQHPEPPAGEWGPL